jgi:hypothetical protein
LLRVVIPSVVIVRVVILSVAFSYCYAECHYAECRYAECRGAVVWAEFSTLSQAVFVITVVVLHRQAHPRL